MGEAPVRGVSSSYGDGVYKSTDAGKTWTHLGLERTRTISRVLVHPRDENTVWVAAQGTRWGPSDDRGVYKSADGGRSWRRVLAGVNATSGPAELSMDPANPRVLYAAFWDHQRLPWYARSGGPGSGLWKSTDGGERWTRLTGGGLPSAMGKTSVAVSPANPERVWALIEGTADSGGLYRSDDAGKAWRLVNGDRVLRARAWYYIHLWPDPKSADVVYVMNAPLLKSTDGGRSFQPVATPHGDNHALWVNPDDPRVMINANDGGANVSVNGGRTWSTQGNQPTAQFYRATVDERFPYRVYGGQQDNTAVMIASRTARAASPSGLGADRRLRERVPGRRRARPQGRVRGLLPGADRGVRPRHARGAPGDGVRHARPVGAERPAEVPLQLDGADPRVAPRPAHRLPRRQRAAAHARRRHDVGARLARPHPQRPQPSGRRRRPLHERGRRRRGVRHRSSTSPSRRATPGCCGPPPTTASCRSRRTPAARGAT
jgi:photosystem II stability/assembly factor-like uncharacterized protein